MSNSKWPRIKWNKVNAELANMTGKKIDFK